MKLKKVLISNFRSVKNTVTVVIDQSTTVLIGANDHGKTNILDAIQCLNTDRPIKAEDVNWDAPEGEAPSIEWYFSIEDQDIPKIKALEVPAAPVQEPAPEPPLAEEVVTIEPVTEPITDSVATEPTPVQSPVQQAVRETVVLNPQAGEEIVFIRNGVDAALEVKTVPSSLEPLPQADRSNLLSLLPKVELFKTPDIGIKDSVSLAELTTTDYEFMQGIFRLAGIWDQKDSLFTQNNKTQKVLDTASTELTKRLNSDWQQGRNLKWMFSPGGNAGDRIIISIGDEAVEERYTSLSHRSSGFKTYFLLKMILLARTASNPTGSYIFLFDEPGTYLHPHAQIDLQRSFEKIAERSQIIYTTHSLFLINKNHPKRNRVVSKSAEGTKLDQRPFQKNWKAIRESLGILLSNNFLIAEKTLLVEGPSDVIYILDCINRLKVLGRIDIDLNDLSIVDAGTSENYVAMAKLMLQEGREVVAIVDGDSGGTAITTQLKKVCKQELTDKKLQIETLPQHKSIEDICCDMPLLQLAIKNVATNMVSLAVKTPNPADLDFAIAAAQIASIAGTTFGKVIDDTTKGWFNPPQSLSKLLIAIEYEDLCKDKPELAPPSEAETCIAKIKTALDIRGEKSVEEGVFEEVI